ncbi:MAG: AMP nucleosidase, partial [Pollutimonas bauzanensis]
MFDTSNSNSPTLLPAVIPFMGFMDARAAVERLVEIYARNTAFIRDAFGEYAQGRFVPKQRVRAYYPAIRIKVDTYQGVDSRLS